MIVFPHHSQTPTVYSRTLNYSVSVVPWTLLKIHACARQKVAHGYTIFASASSSFNKLFVWDVPPTSAPRGQAWGASLTPGPMFYTHHTKFQGSTHQIHSQKLLQVPTTSLLDHDVSAWAGCKWNHQASSERPHGYNVAYVTRLIQSVHLSSQGRDVCGEFWTFSN